jgi:hypothetical protein
LAQGASPNGITVIPDCGFISTRERAATCALILGEGSVLKKPKRFFSTTSFLSYRSDMPEQYCATGWVKGQLYSLVYEIREDEKGEYYHLVTLWNPPKKRSVFMKRTRKNKKPISAEAIARMADRGEDISRFFTGGKMMKPIQRVNVDLTGEMLMELDREAADLNISRQAVIKTLVREGLDRRRLFRGRDREGSHRRASSRS